VEVEGLSHSKIRVLVVDDSALVRKLLRDILLSDPELEVAGMASNGIEAIRAVAELKPDVVTMDIHMPEMDGITALEFIMRKNPVPVVVLSALAQKGAAPTLRALELGAVDFVTKPSHFPSAVREVREEVLLKVKAAAKAKVSLLAERERKAAGASRRKLPTRGPGARKLVVIGASAGGPRALAEIIPMFPRDFPASIVIVQHMPAQFTRPFAERLNGVGRLPVSEAEDEDPLEPGRVLVAPGGRDTIIVREPSGKGRIQLMDSTNRTGATPRIDTTMITAAEAYGSEVIGVLMTGMGSDGVDGLRKIKERKGVTIAQDEETCLVFGMPRVAIMRGVVDHVVPLERIPEKIMESL
jgi:two-component system chemotaxis response regulator CheB